MSSALNVVVASSPRWNTNTNTTGNQVDRNRIPSRSRTLSEASISSISSNKSKQYKVKSNRSTSIGIAEGTNNEDESDVLVETQPSSTDVASASITNNIDNNSSWWNLFSLNVLRNASNNLQNNVSKEFSENVEPKVFLANERTFLAWLDISVTLAAISVAVLAMSEYTEWSVVSGLVILPISISFCLYSLSLYLKRNTMLRRKMPGPYYSNYGPFLMGGVMVCSLSVYLIYSLMKL